MLELQHLLEDTGHAVFFAGKSLQELGMKVRRLACLVEETEADTWVVHAAPRDVLEWFAAQPMPAFSLVCADDTPDFGWCQPSVGCIHWDYRPVYSASCAGPTTWPRGKDDRRQTFTPAEFLAGGTVGPVKD